MSDELKPCKRCGGKAMLVINDSEHEYDWDWFVQCKACYERTDTYSSIDKAIAAWNKRADDAQVIKNAENYKLADDSGPQVIANAEKHELADSREKLEADVDALFKYQTLRDSLVKHVVGLLDRQAAITRRETDEIRDCADCAEGMLANMQRQIDSLTIERDELERANSRQARKIHDVCELNEKLTAERDKWKTKCDTREVAYKQADAERKRYSEQIDELTAERDELERANNRQARKITAVCDLNDVQSKRIKELEAERDELQSIIDHMPKTEQECEACQEAHDRLMFLGGMKHQELQTKVDKLAEKLHEKQHVCDIQRDSFAKMEREYRELQDVCGELERTIENMRGD